ncbi:MAG: exodeoxyribonuclease VII small subunit [Oribacterium sp.]|jgi:exodeoxyribonuclease VII small subunit|nr:exodeoxyribonuclease VII small subunit [Oribacterium sp.]MDY6309113.1 exodeoxyribonuclease VII small subunit [Oribacterium sp.]MDY6317257.1 exodeoxyribonuclease VII small subunit [Oribacterium sp.]
MAEEKKTVAGDKGTASESKEKKLTLSETFEALDTLIKDMEKEQSLEKTFDMYKKGIGLLKDADASIDKIEKQVKVLDEDGILS